MPALEGTFQVYLSLPFICHIGATEVEDLLNTSWEKRLACFHPASATARPHWGASGSFLVL